MNEPTVERSLKRTGNSSGSQTRVMPPASATSARVVTSNGRHFPSAVGAALTPRGRGRPATNVDAETPIPAFRNTRRSIVSSV